MALWVNNEKINPFLKAEALNRQLFKEELRSFLLSRMALLANRQLITSDDRDVGKLKSQACSVGM